MCGKYCATFQVFGALKTNDNGAATGLKIYMSTLIQSSGLPSPLGKHNSTGGGRFLQEDGEFLARGPIDPARLA
jgi:hypothetical protein